MMVILIPEDSESERHVLLTVQPRVAAGSLALTELPAGMVDEEGNFAGAAAREIMEELGLEIREEDLICLSDLAASEEAAEQNGAEKIPAALFPSPGACDEYIPLYLHQRKVPREQLGEWTGRLTGLREEGEKITLKLVRMENLWKEGARDAKCLAALALWEGLRREGKI
jgi:8-oxo-dGTP pyrophosphatase MutT (NUDIX family)